MEIFNSAYKDMFGGDLDASLGKGKKKLLPAGKKNIKGIQGNLFSETVRSRDQMKYLSFTKVLGLAERAWAQSPSWSSIADKDKRKTKLDEEWNVFANLLGGREFSRLNFLAGGVNFRIPPVGAKIEKGKLYANVAFPSLVISYSTDGSEPTKDSKVYLAPINISGTIKLRAFDNIGRG